MRTIIMAISTGIDVLLTISIGLKPMIVDAYIITAAAGDIVRPRVAPIAPIIPKSIAAIVSTI